MRFAFCRHGAALAAAALLAGCATSGPLVMTQPDKVRAFAEAQGVPAECATRVDWYNTERIDVHTDPACMRNYEGTIGVATVQDERGVFITALVPDGAAMTSGELHPGDRLLAVAEAGAPFRSLDGLPPAQANLVIRGEVGSQVTVRVQAADQAESREVTLTRALTTARQLRALAAEQRARPLDTLVLESNRGAYLSPYTSDGVAAEWVDKAINARMGAATGSAVGAAAGAYAGRKALESVPGGGMLGSLLGGMMGSDAGKGVGRDTAIQASGGWDYIRSTSDLSFRSVDDMARWLLNEHGDNPTFAEVIKATSAVYPDLQPALARAR